MDSDEVALVGDDTLWARFVSTADREQLLDSVERMAKSHEETIDYQWTGESADEPPTRMTQDIELVRSLLTSSGYEEVSVVTGVDTELADGGRLGNFYAMPDPGRPRWTAKVVYRRKLDHPE